MAGYLSDQIDSTKGVKVHISDASGAQITSFGSGTTDGSAFTVDTTGGTIAMGVYEATPSTIADGDAAAVGIDANRNQKVTQATSQAGEDFVIDVTKVEQRFTFLHCTADTAVKSGAGFLHTLTFAQTDAAPTAGTIIVYDNTAESGTIIYSETFDTTVFRGYTVTIDAAFSTGLYVGFTTTADVGVTVSYR